MTLAAALQNFALFLIPCLIYAGVVRWRSGFGAREIAKRLGLSVGGARWYLIALGVALPTCGLTTWISQWTKGFEGSMLAPFADQPPSLDLISAAFIYGFISTGIPEELLFRGLIGGALFRRMSFWTANFIQAGIFLLPHLLILLVAPELWPLAVVLPMLGGLAAGWVRERSGSIGPAAVLHALPNAAGALAVLDWAQ